MRSYAFSLADFSEGQYSVSTLTDYILTQIDVDSFGITQEKNQVRFLILVDRLT